MQPPIGPSLEDVLVALAKEQGNGWSPRSLYCVDVDPRFR